MLENPGFVRRRNVRRALAVLIAGGLSIATAQAEPAFARLYKNQFGYQPSCNACHKDGGGSPLNPYGEQFKQHKMTAAALAAIEKLDADGDGVANGAEAKGKANPGSGKSTPKSPGDWLDTASLIPKEVQAAFPGIRAYLPKDAVLTPDEIARAKTMGAALSAADENTIYIPVGADKKPVGTAIIAPGKFKNKNFFVLLTTDAKLNVQKAEALNAKQVPEAGKSKIYASYAGKNLKDLPVAKDTSSVDGAITEAVKKAGTLVYVRLKKD